MIRSEQIIQKWWAILVVMFVVITYKSPLQAQNTVGIGTASPNVNSVLDLVSPQGNQGVLLPRLTTTQRQNMAPSLNSSENGLIVFDTDLKLFFHWVDVAWTVGLGSFSNLAGGDLQGTYPNPLLRDDAVTTNKIVDGTITTPDLADNIITIQKIDPQGNNDVVLGTDGTGNPQWEPKSNFLDNSLSDGNIIIGDASNNAQPRVVSGDISMANDGTATISDDAVDSGKIIDGSIATSDIGSDAVTADEIASGAVGTDEIQDGSIANADMGADAVNGSNIIDGAVETQDLASGGNNKVLITTAAGTVFWENISLFETSTLAEGNIFIGDVSNTAAPLNVKGAGRILIGDGTSLQSLNVNGDISLSSSGNAQLNSGVVGSAEVSDNSLTLDDIGPNAIEASELADNAVDNGALQDNAVNSAKIVDGGVATNDLADDAVAVAKIDGGGNTNAVMTTDGSGDPQWETRSNFVTSGLPDAQILVGDGSGVAQNRAVTGDISLNNTGNMQLNSSTVGTNEVIDNSLTVDDIGPNAIEASELADNAVDAAAIQSAAVGTAEIADNAVTLSKINGGGNNNSLLTTDAAGTAQWEPKSTLDTDDTNELNTGAGLSGTVLSVTDAGGPVSVDLVSLVDDADADPVNEIQDLSSVLSQGANAGGVAIGNLSDPTNAQDAVTKNYVDNIVIDGTNISNNSIGSNHISNGSITSADIGSGEISTPNLADGAVNSTKIQDLSITNNDISNTANIGATKLNSTVMVEGEDVSLLNNDAGYLTSVSSAAIVDGTIDDADISNTADIAASKLQTSVMTESEDVSLLNNDAGYLTSVNSVNIVDGTITNNDISNLAGIAGSKINPDFGSQNIQTTGSLNSGAATVSSLTVNNLGGAADTYTGDGAVNSFTISAGGLFSSSDRRLKHEIKDISQALEAIEQIEGKSYTFKTDQAQQVHFGVIAQDLQRLFPNLVRKNGNGYLSVNYLELIPLLIEAIKEQQVLIGALAGSLDNQKNINASLAKSIERQKLLMETQQLLIHQMQAEKLQMSKDIELIKYSLGLEAEGK